MPYIKTDILCNNEIFLPQTEIQISEIKPSAYDKQTFVVGKIETTKYLQINVESVFTVKISDERSEEIKLTNFNIKSNKTEFRFKVVKPISKKDFLNLETI